MTTLVALLHNSFMKPVKAMTVRLSADQAEALETVATVENRPISDVIRTAIAAHLEGQRDPTIEGTPKVKEKKVKRITNVSVPTITAAGDVVTLPSLFLATYLVIDVPDEALVTTTYAPAGSTNPAGTREVVKEVR